MTTLSQLSLGASTLIQVALPDLLFKTPESYHASILTQLQEQAVYLVSELNKIKGLTAFLPEAAIYCMVRIDLAEFVNISSDTEFVKLLTSEESVSVLPGSVFQAHNYMRIVISAPLHILKEFVSRITQFCIRHQNNEVGVGVALVPSTIISVK